MEVSRYAQGFITPGSSRTRLERLRTIGLPVLLALALLAMQTSALAHDHSGGAEPAYDCALCLQLTSSDAIPTKYSLPQVRETDSRDSAIARTGTLQQPRSANARAPPLVLV